METKLPKTVLSQRSLKPSVSAWRAFASEEIKLLNPQTKPLFFNKLVKYKKKSCYVSTMAHEGITGYYQLIDINGDYVNFDKLMIDRHIVPNNQLFVEYVKLKSAIPDDWDETSRQNDDIKTITIFKTMRCTPCLHHKLQIRQLHRTHVYT